MLKPIQLPDESATPYLTATNFVEAFNQEVRSLYLLSFLLTADHDKAARGGPPYLVLVVDAALLLLSLGWT